MPRQQIVDIRVAGRLWDWAIPFRLYTMGPFCLPVKDKPQTETLLAAWERPEEFLGRVCYPRDTMAYAFK